MLPQIPELDLELGYIERDLQDHTAAANILYPKDHTTKPPLRPELDLELGFLERDLQNRTTSPNTQLKFRVRELELNHHKQRNQPSSSKPTCFFFSLLTFPNYQVILANFAEWPKTP